MLTFNLKGQVRFWERRLMAMALMMFGTFGHQIQGNVVKPFPAAAPAQTRLLSALKGQKSK